MKRALALLAGLIAGPIAGLIVPIAASAQQGAPKTITAQMQGTAVLVQSSYDVSTSNSTSMVMGADGDANGGEVLLFSIALAPGASLDVNLPALAFDATSPAGNALGVAVTIRACVGSAASESRCVNPHADAKGALVMDIGALLAGTPKGTRVSVFAAPTCSSSPAPARGAYAGVLTVQYLNPVT